MTEAGRAILDNYISIADILEAAVAAATGLSGLEGKKGEPSEASVAIDAYVSGGKRSGGDDFRRVHRPLSSLDLKRKSSRVYRGLTY